jgi:hypothetical protein
MNIFQGCKIKLRSFTVIKDKSSRIRHPFYYKSDMKNNKMSMVVTVSSFITVVTTLLLPTLSVNHFQAQISLSTYPDDYQHISLSL